MLCAVMLFLLAGGCGHKTVLPPVAAGGDSVLPAQGQRHRLAVVRTAQALVGVPYRWGGSSPQQGFDCSGLVWWVMRHNGIAVPRMTDGQAQTGTAVAPAQAAAGDIAVFRIGYGGLHTAVISGSGTMVHSPKSGSTVREESYLSRYWLPRLVTVRRILP